MRRGFISMVALVATAATIFATGTVEEPDNLPDSNTTPFGIGRRDVPGTPDLEIAARATNFFGTPVRDFEGTRIGDVVDVAVDLSASYAPYLIVSRNGDKIPVPVSLFRFPREFRLSSEEGERANQSFFVHVQDIARLEAAPTLSEINPTDAITDVIWDDRVHSYWAYSGVQAPPVAFTGGYRRYRFVGAGGGMRVLLAAVATVSELVGRSVVAENGAPVAEIIDVLLSVPSAETPYLLLATQFGNRLVPLEAFTLVDTTGRIRLAGSEALLRLAPGPPFRPGTSVRDPEWDTELRSYWRSSDVLVATKPGMRVLPGDLVRARRLKDIRVINTTGVPLGRIVEYLTTRGGAVTYGILAPYAEPGGSGEHIPVPISAFTIDRKKTYAVTGLDRQEIARMPSVSTSEYQDLGWEGAVAAYWSDRHDLTFETRGEQLVPYSAFLGAEVVTVDGAADGVAADALFDLADGRIASVVVERSAGIGSELVPVPLQFLELQSDRISLLVDESTLDAAPLLDEAAWPEIQSDVEVREYWSRIEREE